jgi:protein-S-isoprenylcysteine O-methyltransferase Ste14
VTPTQNLVRILWAVFGLVWLAAAFRNKPTARRQPAGSVMVHVSVLGLGLLLLFGKFFGVGFLVRKFLPGSAVLDWFSVLLTLAGMGLAFWARIYLGGNWSGTVTLKRDHSLVRGGPYAWVRHPIYSGILLMVVGMVLALREIRGLIGFGILLLEWKRKSLLEERLLIEQFGAQYVQYRREVKGLIPFVW